MLHLKNTYASLVRKSPRDQCNYGNHGREYPDVKSSPT